MMEATKLEFEEPEMGNLADYKKWLNVPATELETILTKYIPDSAMCTLALVEIESFAHVTYEEEPEQE